MAPRFETFSEDEICAINVAVILRRRLWLVGVHW